MLTFLTSKIMDTSKHPEKIESILFDFLDVYILTQRQKNKQQEELSVVLLTTLNNEETAIRRKSTSIILRDVFLK